MQGFPRFMVCPDTDGRGEIMICVDDEFPFFVRFTDDAGDGGYEHQWPDGRTLRRFRWSRKTPNQEEFKALMRDAEEDLEGESKYG